MRMILGIGLCAVLVACGNSKPLQPTNGVDGKDGINGINGKDGADGYNGAKGNDGINGSNGIDGIDGTNGIDGINGSNGVDGSNGINGIGGINGIDGINGSNGIDGIDGINGTNGQDAIPCKTSETFSHTTIICPTSTSTIEKPYVHKTPDTTVYQTGFDKVESLEFTCIADKKALRVRTPALSYITFRKVGEFSTSMLLRGGSEFYLTSNSGGGTFIIDDMFTKITKACSF